MTRHHRGPPRLCLRCFAWAALGLGYLLAGWLVYSSALRPLTDLAAPWLGRHPWRESDERLLQARLGGRGRSPLSIAVWLYGPLNLGCLKRGPPFLLAFDPAEATTFVSSVGWGLDGYGKAMVRSISRSAVAAQFLGDPEQAHSLLLSTSGRPRRVPRMGVTAE